MTRKPRPRVNETVGNYQARCLHAEGRTVADVKLWVDYEWIAFQNRVNPSAGARTDETYTEDMICRLGMLTGEHVRIF